MPDLCINFDAATVAPKIHTMSLLCIVTVTLARWPSRATCASQEHDGQVMFWTAPVWEVAHARLNSNMDDGPLVMAGLGEPVERFYFKINKQPYVAFDWQRAVVTKEQYLVEAQVRQTALSH
ncbi:hypothetical protein [Pseudoalteromonas rubra]|uniref:Uncharacterized protein n=1 Tax=Pseudoalteromonas rubra TaxID=43658 RepID=A0A0U2ZE93_9GAMM|nr:hypothetical protein [Pseudoalteromonas rubra]ALU46129.1 hypothetical protein AT705_24515 [Pseudoalteromonas rubra]